jgi:hypothetical protein
MRPVAAPVLRLRVPEDTLARDEARGEDTRSAWSTVVGLSRRLPGLTG